MLLRNQFAAHNLRVPTDHKGRRITDLADKGLLTALNEHGFPFTTALGHLLLDNVEHVLTLRAAQAGIDMVQLPTAMETETLERGQELGERFRAKIMHLTGSLADHHVISSPETLFVQLGQTDQIAHGQLPIRYSYLNNLHRQKTNGRGALFPQQIKIFGGVTVAKPELAGQEILLMDDVIQQSFTDMALPFHREDGYNGFDHEYFYICDPANEGENLALPGVSETTRVKAYSMGMIYNYPMMADYRLRYRSEENKNKAPAMISYGFCTPRILHCALHAHHDEAGFNLPASLRPFDVSIIPAHDRNIGKARELYQELRRQFLLNSGNNPRSISRVCLDDRLKISTAERQDFAAYLGTPVSLTIDNDGYKLMARNGDGLGIAASHQEIMQMVTHQTAADAPALGNI